MRNIFAQAREVRYALLSSVLLSLNLFCECQIFQAFLHRHMPEKLQLSFSDVKYMLPISLHFLQKFVIAHMFHLWYPQRSSIELHFS